MNKSIWLLLSMALLAALAIVGSIGLARSANASFPVGAASTTSSSNPQSAQPILDPYVTNFNCADITSLHIDRQTNLRATLILQKCGYGTRSGGTNPATSRNARNSALSSAGAGALKQLTSPLLGGADVDVILPDGTYPHVTQSEAMNWVHGSTVVVNYNDHSYCVAGIAYSTDGGVTFQHSGHQLCTGHGVNYGDPVVVYNAALSTWFAGDIATGCGGAGIGLWTSPDGITWTPGACAHGGSNDDRESMWVDDNPISPHYGRMYVSFNNLSLGGALQVIYSDNGTSWSNPYAVATAFIQDVQITGDLQGSGKVYLAGADLGGGGLANHTNLMFRSTDGGVTWAYSIMGAAFPGPGRAANGFYPLVFSSMWRSTGWGEPAAIGNNVYYDWAQCGQDVVCSGATDHGDIYFQRSTDSGVTWSSPLKLNTDTGTAMQWQPSLAATGAGAIYAGWYDERDANGGADLDCTPGNAAQPCYARWGRVSLDGGATWQADAGVGDVVSPLPADTDGGIYEGDYDYITSDGDTVYDHWTDGRVAINNTSQQDVFLDRINIPVGTPTPTVTGTPPTSTPTLAPANTPTSTPTVCGVPVWQAGPTMTPDRWAIQGAVGSDGNVYVANGLDAAGTPLPAQMARYDPHANSWSNVAPPPVAVGEYSMAAEGGKIFIAGGFLEGTSITGTLQIYDIAANTWSLGAPMPTSVEAAAGVALNGKLYVVGGDNFNNSLRSTYIYDIASDTWTTGPQIPDIHGRTDTYGTTAGGLVYVWGGYDYTANVTIDNLIAYNPGTNSWTTLASANTGGLGDYGGVSSYGTGKLFITDGGNINFVPGATTHIYDIASNTWTSGPPMMQARLGHAQATLPDGRVFVYAGLGYPELTGTSELLSVPPCSTPTTTPTTTPTNTPTNTPTTEVSTDTPTAGAPTSTGTAAQTTSTATSTATLTVTPTVCTLFFSDVLPGSTFYPYIHCLSCLGIINGYSDGSFRPNNDVTRGQLSKIVSNSAGFSNNQTTPLFQDVSVGSTFFQYIGRLASRGYISGYDCGGSGEPCVPPANLPYFRPNSNATRGQISKIVSNAAGFSDRPSGQEFQDVAVGSTYYTYTYRLASRTIMQGYQCGGPNEPCVPPANLPYFRPNANATRGADIEDRVGLFLPRL